MHSFVTSDDDVSTPGQITLYFSNLAAGFAFFEIRIDGVPTGSTNHPVVIGDKIHTGGVGVASGTTTSNTFFANSTVDVRLALGGEADYRFDWTRHLTLLPSRSPLRCGGGLALMGVIGPAPAQEQARRLSCADADQPKKGARLRAGSFSFSPHALLDAMEPGLSKRVGSRRLR